MVKTTNKTGFLDDFEDFNGKEEPVPVEAAIIENPQWADYDWTDWANYWGISIEQTRINFETSNDESKVNYVLANQIIQKEAEEKRQALAKGKAEKAAHQAYLKKVAAEKNEKQNTTSLFEATSYRQTSQDKSEAKRHALYQEILSQESSLDDLSSMSHKLTENKENFISDLRRTMDETRYVLEEKAHFNTSHAQNKNDSYQRLSATLSARAENRDEIMTETVRTTRRELEDKIDLLNRERNNLPW